MPEPDAPQVRSPLTGSDRVRVVTRHPVERLRRFYMGHLGVDVERFLDGLDDVVQYRCEDTGLEFYSPPSLAGDDAFYDSISRHAWYYDPDRWEHRTAVEWLGPTDRVLDVGCGSGAFLEQIREHHPGCSAEGIELSPKAAALAVARGLQVTVRSLDDLIADEPGGFDVVTSFQVLEHVPDPAGFLGGLVAALRPGGTLIIGVPNNDGYVGLTDNLLSYPLNMPPHHMGMWREGSLKALTGLFPLEHVRTACEPIDANSRSRLAYSRVARAFGDGKLAGLAWRLRLHTLYEKMKRHELSTVAGHTILVAYRRTDGQTPPDGSAAL